MNNIILDSKGRLAIPVRYREQLLQLCNGAMVVTIDTDEKCLLIYPEPEWNLIQGKVEALPSLDAFSRRIQRLLIGHATDIRMDGTGRILLTLPLREYARLDKKVVLLGQGSKLELWDEALWQSRRDEWISDPSAGEIPEALRSLSL